MSTRTASSPVDPGRAARGVGLVLLELVFIAYVVMWIRGDWPPGHPWTVLVGAMGLGAVLVPDGTLAAALVGLAVVSGGAAVALL